MDNEQNMPIPKEMVLKACEIEYSNALSKCLDGQNLAFYMFVAGLKFERKREMPKYYFDELIENFNNKK